MTKSITMVVGEGSVRVEWDESVPDLIVKLSCAELLRCNLANLNSLERGVSEERPGLPPAAAVVDFANKAAG